MKHKNLIKKTISFLTIICCLAGSLLPAYAAEPGGPNPPQTGTGSSETPAEPPRVTFTNEPNNSPDLFVSKIVENAVSGAQYAAPEHAAYRFVLKIDGKVAANEEYRLLDSQYGELVKKSNGRKVPFKTDSAGVFTLEDGQKAWFEYVGTGRKYEVIELPDYLHPIMNEDGKEKEADDGYELYIYDAESETAGISTGRRELEYQMRSLYVDGYEQLSPAGDSVNGAATGEKTILFNGNQETFTNRYTGKGTGDMATLKVSKSISFPTGYTTPETPDFRFKVELDGSPYAGKSYTVIDTATGKPVMTASAVPVPDKEEESGDGENESSGAGEEKPVPLSGITDENGCFTLKGGQTAVFENIPTELDYKVSELLEEREGAEKWWAVGDTVKKGATQAPLTSVSFTNANVSFLVTKRMEDYSKPDVEFTFRLADDKNDALGGVSYYLYHTNGIPVYDQDGKHVKGSTGEGGEFHLKPGQTAVFVGMEPGKSFKVTEEADPLYTQVLPLPTVDKIYTVPGGGQPAYVDFVNKPADNEGVLTVTKKLTYDNEGPLAEDDFHFVLYKQLKTPDDVKEAFDIWKVWFIEVGSVTDEKIEEKVDSGGIVLLKADGNVSGENSGTSGTTGETEGLPSSIKLVNGICCYEKDGTRYELYAPLKDAIYSVAEGLGISTYKTDSNGEFTIKANQTARFEILSTGYKYLVREIGLTKEYTELYTDSAPYKTIYVSGQTEAYAQIAELSGTGISFLFNNYYRPQKVSLNLTKIDKDGNSITDTPAHFMLYLEKGKENPVYEDAFIATGGDGTLTFPDLKAGTYWLYELKAPSGYKLLAEPIEIQIAWGTDGSPVVTIDGKPSEDPKSDVVKNFEIEETGKNADGSGATDGNENTDNRYTIHFEVVNADFYKLPSTGDIGIYWYMIGGVLLMMAASLILYRNKRAGEVQGH